MQLSTVVRRAKGRILALVTAATVVGFLAWSAAADRTTSCVPADAPKAPTRATISPILPNLRMLVVPCMFQVLFVHFTACHRPTANASRISKAV